MDCTLQHDRDPLDLELVERAVQGALDAIKVGSGELESDEELELALRLELPEMVRAMA
jgi:hypothetical protein